VLTTSNGSELKEIRLDDIAEAAKADTRIFKKCPFYTVYPDGREEKCANCNKFGRYMLGNDEYICSIYEFFTELEAVLQ